MGALWGDFMFKKFYYLLNHEINSTYKSMLLISGLLIILENILFYFTAENYLDGRHYLPFEVLIANSGTSIIFLVGIMATLFVCCSIVMMNYFRSKSIYTLMSIPFDRKYVYSAKLTVMLLYFGLLISAQIISILIGYVLFKSPISTDTQITYADCSYGAIIINTPIYATNGLFIAFMRSDFLRLLLPYSINYLLFNLILLLALATMTYHACLILLSGYKPYWLISLLIPLACIGKFILIRLNEPYYNYEAFCYICLLAVCTLFYIKHSLHLIKQSKCI